MNGCSTRFVEKDSDFITATVTGGVKERSTTIAIPFISRILGAFDRDDIHDMDAMTVRR